jgi:hypothetical protein
MLAGPGYTHDTSLPLTPLPPRPAFASPSPPASPHADSVRSVRRLPLGESNPADDKSNTEAPSRSASPLASTAPSTGSKSTKKLSEIHATRRLPKPHGRTNTSLNRNRRAQVRASSGSRWPRSSATGHSIFTRGTRARNRLPTSILGCMNLAATTITRSSLSTICAGRAALT